MADEKTPTVAPEAATPAPAAATPTPPPAAAAPAASPVAKTPAAPILGIADLATVVQLIDTVSRRGGFEGSELALVGSLRQKFVDFVQANTPKANAGPAVSVPSAPLQA